jgi:hypothetical protein
MRRSFLFLVLVALSIPALRAQTLDTPVASVQSCPSTATTDQLITAIDAAISGPADKDRTCFRQLFLPEARLIPIRIAADGTATPRILTVQDWIDAVAKRGSQVFYERQLKVRTESWAHLAHLWSTYETRTTADAKPSDSKPPEGKASQTKPMDRGINSIQAVYDGKQWHVLEILWQAETPTDPIPEKYLP